MAQEGERTANTKEAHFSGNGPAFKDVDTEMLQS